MKVDDVVACISYAFKCDFVYGPKAGPLRASVKNQEQRAFIKCRVLLNTSVAEVNSYLIKQLGEVH